MSLLPGTCDGGDRRSLEPFDFARARSPKRRLKLFNPRVVSRANLLAQLLKKPARIGVLRRIPQSGFPQVRLDEKGPPSVFVALQSVASPDLRGRPRA